MKKCILVLFVIAMLAVLCACEFNSCEHNFVEVSRQKGTCIAAGTATFKCTLCEEEKIETTEFGNHSFDAGTITTAATCTSAGTKTFTCTLCDDTKTETVPQTKHSYNNGEVTTEATCTAAGTKTFTCSGCGDTKTESIAKKNHNYDKSKVTAEATCTATGTKTYTCSACGDTKTETIEKKSHNYGSGKVTTAATCTATGTKTYTCSGCGKTKTETIEKKSHEYSKATCTAAATCSVCGKKNGSALGHNWSDATCSSAKKCSRCKKTEGEPLTHDYNSSGKCSYCGEAAQATFILPSTPQTIGYYSSYSGTKYSSCEVSSITVSLYSAYGDEVDYQITFVGTSTYNNDGNTSSTSMKIGYKLYDSEGFVVDSGTAYTEAVAVGEKFKETIYVWDLTPGETYTLEIMDVR